MAIAAVLSSASTTNIRWFLWLFYLLSLFMSQSCLADDPQFKFHRGLILSRKLCPSCKPYPFFRNSPIVAARESIAWIPVRASISAAAVMVLLCSFLWHMNRRNHLYEEELQENGQDQTGNILGSREGTTGNVDDYTDDTFEEGNLQVECPDLSLFPLDLIRKVTKYFSIEKKIGNQVVVETQDLPLFPLDVISKATQHFSVENKLGEGGFGPVYKGILGDGKEIAVKRLSKTSRQGIEEFEKEVTLLCKLQHENVVRLLGCCTERNELILIFEYIPNKSLHDVLFDSRTGRVLEWKTRISIINGIAQGLLYLHEALQLIIIHRDLKLRNVLLDNAMNPKISDFGLAIIFDAYQFEATTCRIVGTLGYMAPEYMMHGQYSVKTDVYSFGVLLLEIISGRKNTYYSYDEFLQDYIWKLWCEGQSLDELVDPAVVQSCDRIELMRCIHIGLLCVQKNPADRPTMSSIVIMLTSDDMNLPQPNIPAFYRSTDTKDISISINELTLSIEFPR
ncbi:hypothetical protein Dsin_027846 [Dipteronia sinensis]|uniref:non-specific serine/threonine protein kinase n=1 Tax=Dipteronia sinensis TaxID=43782 RepID=A0AAD9ZQ57_9ROSI|nr:hypothetical protein Dsin_027846 [Dipteronia sinensis]